MLILSSVKGEWLARCFHCVLGHGNLAFIGYNMRQFLVIPNLMFEKFDIRKAFIGLNPK